MRREASCAISAVLVAAAVAVVAIGGVAYADQAECVGQGEIEVLLSPDEHLQCCRVVRACPESSSSIIYDGLYCSIRDVELSCKNDPSLKSHSSDGATTLVHEKTLLFAASPIVSTIKQIDGREVATFKQILAPPSDGRLLINDPRIAFVPSVMRGGRAVFAISQTQGPGDNRSLSISLFPIDAMAKQSAKLDRQLSANSGTHSLDHLQPWFSGEYNVLGNLENCKLGAGANLFFSSRPQLLNGYGCALVEKRFLENLCRNRSRLNRGGDFDATLATEVCENGHGSKPVRPAE